MKIDIKYQLTKLRDSSKLRYLKIMKKKYRLDQKVMAFINEEEKKYD